jgi:hypothetical protein
MEDVVAPLLHNSEPETPEAVKTELPQLFTTETTGADGIGPGEAAALPGALVHPFTVWLTV